MLTRRQFSLMSASFMGVAACGSKDTQSNQIAPIESNTQTVETFDPRVAEVIDPNADWNILADGYWWAEGPSWDKKREQLYFTDVPQNKAFVWKEGEGAKLFLDPSGAAVTEGFREPGANGLFCLDDDTMILANHGKRAVEKVNLSDLTRSTLVDNFEGLRFNSPNDIFVSDRGDIYFTDPPYGLEGLDVSPLKELSHNGVYKLSAEGKLFLIADEFTFPNGVALSPDNKTLFVTQSDPQAPIVYKIDLSGEASSERDIFVDMSVYQSEEAPGLPDGLAVTETGDMFITGPGGVFIITHTGDVLGRIRTGSATANCAFGEDGHTLFITAQDRLLKIRTRVRGLGWT